MIKDFGAFDPAELAAAPVSRWGDSAGLVYDPERDIAWIVLCDPSQVDPSRVWLGEDERLHAAAHLDEDGFLLGVAIGEASRHLPPSLVLRPGYHPITVAMHPSADALQILFEDAPPDVGSALTMLGQEGVMQLHFLRAPSALLVALVVEPASAVVHDSLVP